MRDELEHLLDDDNDMDEMYLTEKLRLTMEQVSMRTEPDQSARMYQVEDDEM